MGQDLAEGRSGEEVSESVNGVVWAGGQHGGNEETVAVQNESYLELPEELSVLLAVRLRKQLALEDVC